MTNEFLLTGNNAMVEMYFHKQSFTCSRWGLWTTTTDQKMSTQQVIPNLQKEIMQTIRLFRVVYHLIIPYNTTICNIS